jgi:glycosyltransferase involved in cell wall biosynthesis
MDIQWLISTCGERIRNVENILLKPARSVSYLVSVQSLNRPFPVIPDGLKRPDVEISLLDGSGVSANRNNALRHATGEIVVIGDDDIGLKPEYPERILGVFQQNANVDVACFQILTTELKPYKTYPVSVTNLSSLKSLKNISSIEIAFRRKKIQEKSIWFDERFGLGRPANCGEEFLFLSECLKNGLTIRFFPVYVVEHPSESSSNMRPFYDETHLFVSGAQNYVLYGTLAYVWNLASLFVRWRTLKKAKIPFQYFIAKKTEGSNYIRKNRSALQHE